MTTTQNTIDTIAAREGWGRPEHLGGSDYAVYRSAPYGQIRHERVRDSELTIGVLWTDGGSIQVVDDCNGEACAVESQPAFEDVMEAIAWAEKHEADLVDAIRARAKVEALVYESGAAVEVGDGVVYTQGPRDDWDYGRVEVDDDGAMQIVWLGTNSDPTKLVSTKGLVAYLTVDGAKSAFEDAVAAAGA